MAMFAFILNRVRDGKWQWCESHGECGRVTQSLRLTDTREAGWTSRRLLDVNGFTLMIYSWNRFIKIN